MALAVCVCVYVSVQVIHTVKTSHWLCVCVCDCVCICHKVSSNWETAALTLAVGLHAKITHKCSHTHTKTQSVSPQCLSPPLLVRTLIRGEHQKARQGKICERQISSVTAEFCFWLFYFSSNMLAKLRSQDRRGRGSGETVRQMEGDREVSRQEMERRDGVRSRTLSLLV